MLIKYFIREISLVNRDNVHVCHHKRLLELWVSAMLLHPSVLPENKISENNCASLTFWEDYRFKITSESRLQGKQEHASIKEHRRTLGFFKVSPGSKATSDYRKVLEKLYKSGAKDIKRHNDQQLENLFNQRLIKNIQKIEQTTSARSNISRIRWGQ